MVKRKAVSTGAGWQSQVTVCGFTFHFPARELLLEAIEFYSRKTHPSCRRPGVGWDIRTYGDRSESQRWFERVPLYLQKEGKRHKVLAALEAALGQQRPIRRTRAPSGTTRKPVPPQKNRA